MSQTNKGTTKEGKRISIKNPSWEQEQKDLNEIFAKAGISVQLTKGVQMKLDTTKEVVFVSNRKNQ